MDIRDALRGTNLHLADIQRKQQIVMDSIAENKRRERQLQIDSAEYLKQISENTKGINEVVDLVRKNNEINERTFELFQEMFTVITAKTPEEADGILRDVINKANQANEDWGTIQTIIGYGKMLGKLSFPEASIFD